MQKRSLVKMFLLYLVTFGIYRLYWLYKTRQEIVGAGHKAPRVIWFVAINAMVYLATIALIVTTIYAGIDLSSRVDDCISTTSMSRSECQVKMESDTSSADIAAFAAMGLFYFDTCSTPSDHFHR